MKTLIVHFNPFVYQQNLTLVDEEGNFINNYSTSVQILDTVIDNVIEQIEDVGRVCFVGNKQLTAKIASNLKEIKNFNEKNVEIIFVEE